MKVILTEEIRGLGTRGDIVTVKDGYARNFLLPKNMAREATAGNLKQIEHERRKWALLSQQEKAEAEKAAAAVKGVRVEIRKRVGEQGHLFGSVTASEIADALMEKGIEVDKRRIELEHPIKDIGRHQVEVRLHREVSATIEVDVLAIGQEKLEETPVPVEKATAAAEEAPAAEE
jgi:large subunit ribosomal protein L9